MDGIAYMNSYGISRNSKKCFNCCGFNIISYSTAKMYHSCKQV